MIPLIEQFAANYPLAFHAVIILASLAIIVKAADYLIRGITDYSEDLGLSGYITGMIVVALAASIPELVSSIMGVVAEDPGIVFGTIIGSCVSGLALGLAVLAMVGRKINLKSKVLKKTEMMVFILLIIPFLLVADGVLSRIDGAILVLLYFAFTVILWKKEGELGSLKKEVKLKRIYKDALLFILALAAILLSSRWLVFSSIEASKIIGVSTYYISLIVIGIGATIPDITVGIRSIFRGNSDIGIGDVLGSELIKLLLFLGVIALIRPLSIDFSILLTAIVFIVISLGVTFYYTEKGRMNWKNGLLLLLLYFAFIIIELLKKGQ